MLRLLQQPLILFLAQVLQDAQALLFQQSQLEEVLHLLLTHQLFARDKRQILSPVVLQHMHGVLV
jgi:hypothetical protein